MAARERERERDQGIGLVVCDSVCGIEPFASDSGGALNRVPLFTMEASPPSHVALRRLGCAGASAAIAAAVTNPIEIIRVRFQLEPQRR